MSDPLTLALDLRHAGQEANLAAAVKPHMDLRSRVEAIVAILAKGGVPFNADSVHKQLEAEIGEGSGGGVAYNRNVVSSVMGRWAQDQRILRVENKGLTPAKNPTRHGSRNGWWIGATYMRRQGVA